MSYPDPDKAGGNPDPVINGEAIPEDQKAPESKEQAQTFSMLEISKKARARLMKNMAEPKPAIMPW